MGQGRRGCMRTRFTAGKAGEASLAGGVVRGTTRARFSFTMMDNVLKVCFKRE